MHTHHHFGDRFSAARSRHPFAGPGRHFGGGRGGRSERGGRVFESGDLRFVLLALISEKPSHGYELIKAIEEKLGGGYSPSPGVIYPTLTLLEELGYAAVQEQVGGKKLYTATEDGRTYLAQNQALVDAIFTRVDAAGARGGRFSPPILRAMENLKTALRYRMADGPLSEAEIRTIAAALDEAALAVERARGG
jgi:DNA-binding PadR family transcriptional regulator